MSILFFGGLPRAGKSYEAMVTQIIPALQKGREVVAYIEGLNFERIAEASGLTVDRVGALLFPLTREDMRGVEGIEAGRKVTRDGAWVGKTRDNALHVFDEAQNWWPNRHRASEQLTQFVTEHGHRGIDILLMGQALGDVLKLWRNRVEQRLEFEKLTALGQENRYQVTIYKGRGGDEYTKVGSQISKYDPKYFGTYASHVSDDTNTLNYVDSRVKVWNNPVIKWGVPIAIGLGIWGATKTWSFFHPPAAEPSKVVQQSGALAPSAPAAPLPPAAPAVRASASVAAPASPPAAAPPPKDLRTVQERYFADLKGRPRLAGMLTMRGETVGVVEWISGSTTVLERLSFAQLRALGVHVEVIQQAAHLRLGEWQVLATSWPMESESRVSEDRQEQIRGRTAPVSSGAVVAGLGSDQLSQPQRHQQPASEWSRALADRNAATRSALSP